MGNPDTASSIELFDHHRPKLASGDYTIKVTQTVGAGTTHWVTESHLREFSLLGPRFSLSPQEVHAVFPPQGSLGDHAKVFPHVVLERSTLPWERSPDHVARNSDAAAVPSWLALLLIREDEEGSVKLEEDQSGPNARRVQTCTIEDLKKREGDGFPQFVALADPERVTPYLLCETGDSDADKLTLVEVKKELFLEIVPTLDQLRLLAHVRGSKSTGEGTDKENAGKEFAVVICNRLPKPGGRNTVHLVSMEGRYGRDGTFNLSGVKDTVRLVCLMSWQFSCTNETNQSFRGLLKKLNRGGLRLLPEAPNSDAESYLGRGSVLLDHSRTDGAGALSWYRGPFVSGETEYPLPDAPVMKVRRAADLVGHNARLGIDDVSYAAAWELGRLLALEDAGASVALYNWRRCCYQDACIKETAAETAHLPCQMQRPKFDFPREWFERLARLRGVPFNYLVPDERMLPHESMRFFLVDRFWVKCLINGAFSIGSGTESECDCCAHHGNKALAQLPLTLSGFLLRSDVVGGWPRLEIDGFDKDKKVLRKGHSPPGPIERLESGVRLSKNVLLCLFEGVVQTVDIHLPPEALHFEVEGNTPDLARFSSSSKLAQAMIARVPRVRFVGKRLVEEDVSTDQC